MESLSIKEIEAACNGQFFGDDDIYHQSTTAIKIDSRIIQKGDVFIAVIGENMDGHHFIDSALDKGALLAITQKPMQNQPHILVESTFQALKDIAEYYRSKFDITVIGVTGSVGKTTAKEMISNVLSQKYSVLKTQGNLNNEFGLPQMIFNIERHHEIAVLEMGMNNFGEISRLSKTARPDISVIMNIGDSHIGNLGSRDGILKAKCEIFDYLKPNGLAVLNGDDDKLKNIKNTAFELMFFGKDQKNFVHLKEIVSMDENGMHIIAGFDDQTISLRIKEPGQHIIYSMLAALGIAKHLKLSDEQIQQGMISFQNVGARNRMIQTDTLTIIDDVYNACKESIFAGADLLQSIQTKGKRIAIIGDIFELGDFSSKTHYTIGQTLANLNIDLFLLVGKDSIYTHQAISENSTKESYHFKTQEDLLDVIRNYVDKNDIIYVKDSRGMGLEKTVNLLKEL